MSIERQIRQVLAELELVSQAPVQNFESSGRDMGEDVGGRRPPGGIDHKGDKDHDWKMKSAEHFRRRLARAPRDVVRRTIILEAVLGEAKEALNGWRRQPAPQDKEHPMPGDYNWKRWVAETEISSNEIARKCHVSSRYVRRIRAQYRGAEAA